MVCPNKATVDYFPHFINQGKTIYMLENRFGEHGYYFWFKLLELLGATQHHYVDCNDPSNWEFMLAKTNSDEKTARCILTLLAKVNAIDHELWENSIIWSENFIKNLDTVYKRRRVKAYNKEDIKSYCLQKPRSPGNNSIQNPQKEVKGSKDTTRDKNQQKSYINNEEEQRRKAERERKRKQQEAIYKKCKVILCYLASVTGKNISTNPRDANKTDLFYRIQEGATVENCKSIIKVKADDEHFQANNFKFMRCSTLFRKKNFHNYLEEAQNYRKNMPSKMFA